MSTGTDTQSRHEAFLVFTTEIGGEMKVWWAPRETYEEAKRTGRLNIEPWADDPKWVELKMVAFASQEELRDFIINPVKRTT